MKARLRATLSIVLGFFAAALLLSGIAVLVLRSNWLRNEVRMRTIAAVERATGGRVELRKFDFDWTTLTADFRGFTLHGTEPLSAPPLLTAADVRMSLPWTVLSRQEFSISSLAIEQPHAYFLVHPDGTTNVPIPKHQQLNSPFDPTRLHIGSISVANGFIECNDRRIPFDLHAAGLSAALEYFPASARYGIKLQIASIANLRSGTRQLPSTASLKLSAQLDRSALNLQELELTSPQASLQARGSVQNFSAPRAEFQAVAKAQASLLTRGVPHVSFGSGSVTLAGHVHYAPLDAVHFDGQLTADKLLFLYPGGQIRDANIGATVVADRAGAVSTDVRLDALGGHFRGAAEIKGWRTLDVHGDVREADTNRLLATLIHQQLPWSGWASGPAQLTAVFSKGDGIVVHTQLHVASKAQGATLNGEVAGTYWQAGNRVLFDRLSVQLPATHVEASGEINQDLALAVDSSDLAQLAPLVPIIARSPVPAWAATFRGSSGRFQGRLTGFILSPRVDGDLAIQDFAAARQNWQRASAHIVASATGVDISRLVAQQGPLHAKGAAHLELQDWSFNDHRNITATLAFEGADVAQLWSKYSGAGPPIFRGVVSGQIRFVGTLQNPNADAQLKMNSLDAFGQDLNQVQVTALVNGDNLIVTEGRINAGPAALTVSGSYHHLRDDWTKGEMILNADSNGFPLNALSSVQRFAPDLSGRIELHGAARARLAEGGPELVRADGRASFRKLTWRGIQAATLNFTAATLTGKVDGVVTGSLEQPGFRQATTTPLTGHMDVSLSPGNAVHAELAAARVDVALLRRLFSGAGNTPASLDGSLSGKVTMDGSLASPASLRAALLLDDVSLQPRPQLHVAANHALQGADFALRNAAPIAIDFGDGTGHIQNLQLKSRYGQLSIAGTFAYAGPDNLDLDVNGDAGLQAFEIFDPNVTSAGAALLSAHIRGTLSQPLVAGSLQIQNGSFYLHNVPNGLTKVNGKLTFTGDRATIQKLTAESGGGTVDLLGFVNFGAGHPLAYNLKGTAGNVRIRYAGAISATGSGALQLTGTTDNGLVTGNLSIERVVISPDADLGSVLASSSASRATPTDEHDFLSGLQMDIRLESAPNLQVSTALSQDVEADVDLQLRGSPDRPLLFGSITANQGQIKVFGAKYSINRGEITFVNTVRIEPVLDLDLQTTARGINVDITVSGTLNKLNLNYRSDPPLQPKDIIALLTVGQPPSFTPNLPNVQPAANDVSALQAGANTVLGQAISPASNRLSKLFGITNIKIDPLVQGITNTPQARLTLEQQISKDVTVTYITNLAQTSEQIFRFEWALTPQYSITAVRDDNGEFGIDFQYKKRFK